MNASRLVKADAPTEEINVWYCGECRIVSADKDHAEQCCVMRRCETCETELGKRWAGSNFCRSCWDKRRVEKAEKIPIEEADGFYFSDRHYFDLDEVFDDYFCDHNGTPPIEYIEATVKEKWKGLDSYRIMENAIEAMELDESCDLEPKAAEEFHAFIASWNAKQTMEFYWPRGKYVDVREAWAAYMAKAPS